MLSIQNRQKRTWIIPHVLKADGSAVFQSINIDPGTSALVNEDHWEHVSKGNKVIEALVSQRALVVKRSGSVAEDIQDADELQNPPSPQAPAELTEKDPRAKVESKVEVKEVAIKDDAPTEGRGRKA